MKHRIREIIVVVVLLFPGSTWASQLVVIESKSPTYNSGDFVETTSMIQLAEGETLELLAEDGRIYRLRGPYEGVAVAGEKAQKQNMLSAMAPLVSSPEQNLRSVGATRGQSAGEPKLGNPEKPPWSHLTIRLTIDGGEQCVVKGMPVKFWRSDANADIKLTVMHLTKGKTVELDWPAGERDLAWPEALPLEDDGFYKVGTGTSMDSRYLNIQEIPPQAVEGPQGVAWLAANGCQWQAKAFFAELQMRALQSYTRGSSR